MEPFHRSIHTPTITPDGWARVARTLGSLTFVPAATIKVTLGGQSFTMKKLDGDVQGGQGVTYQVDHTRDFAKTNTAESAGSLADEIEINKLVRLAFHGLYIVSG